MSVEESPKTVSELPSSRPSFHMRPEDFRHEWAIPRNALWIRFYLWVWEAEANEITFCKLFWGYLFTFAIPIAIPIRIVVAILRFPIKEFRDARQRLRQDSVPSPIPSPVIQLRKRVTAGRTTQVEALKAIPPDCYWVIKGPGGLLTTRTTLKFAFCFDHPGKYELTLEAWDKRWRKRFTVEKTIVVHAKPGIPTRTLEAIEMGGSRAIVYVFSFLTAKTRPVRAPVVSVMKFPFRTLKRTVVSSFVALVCLFITAAAFGNPSHEAAAVNAVWLTVRNPVADGAIFVGVLLAICAGVLIGGPFVTLAYCWGVKERELPQGFWRHVLRPFGRKVGHGGMTFRDAMAIGYRAVKSRSCARVILIEEETHEGS